MSYPCLIKADILGKKRATYTSINSKNLVCDPLKMLVRQRKRKDEDQTKLCRKQDEMSGNTFWGRGRYQRNSLVISLETDLFSSERHKSLNFCPKIQDFTDGTC